MSKVSYAHWEKVIDLIDRAKKDDSIKKVFAGGSASQKIAVLKESGITMEDMERLCADLEALAPRALDDEMPPREVLYPGGPWWIYWPPAGPRIGL